MKSVADRASSLGWYGALSLFSLALFAGLVAKGANDAVLAPILAATLLVLLAGSIMQASASRTKAILGRDSVMLAGAVAFIAWALIGMAPASGAFVHPLWRSFGFLHGTLSIAPHRAIEGVVQFLCPAAAYGLGAFAGFAQRDRLGRVLGVFAVLYASWALLVFVANPSATGGRLMANLGSANAAALTFAILGFFCLAQIARARRARSYEGALSALTGPILATPVSGLGLILSASCLFLTGSRGGMACSGVALVLLLVMLASIFHRRGEARAPLVFVSAMVGLLAISGASFALDRFANLEADAGTRATLRDAHWAAFLDRPILGHGINTFHELNAHYATPETFATLNAVGSAHNIYVQALEEGGVVGFGLLALCIVPPLTRAATNALRRRSGAEWSAAVLAAAIAALLHGVVDFGLQVPAIAALFAFLMGAFSGGRLSRHDAHAAPAQS